MTDSQTPTYRSHTIPQGDSIQYRQAEDEDGVFEVRMPIATTGEVRNQGDDPLTRDELDGMARQINDRGLGVFLDHGGSSLGGPSKYSAVEKLGEWTDATVDGERDDGKDALMATARLMDPESLPSGVKELRAAVGAIQEQVKRGFSISASIGWREDEDFPGGNDLMEASIVGIGADPETVSQSDRAEMVARAALDAGADPEELVATVRAAVEGATDTDTDQDMSDDDTPDDDGGTTDDEQDVSDNEEQEQEGTEQTEREAPEWASALLEAQERQTELLQSLADDLREDEEDEDDDDEEEQETDEDDDEEEDEDDEESQSTDDAVVDERIAELEAELEDIRAGNFENLDVPDDGETDEEQEADADGEDGDPLKKYNLAPN